MTTMQLGLFTELEERPRQPDEAFQLPGKTGGATAQVTLAHVPGTGWIYATRVSLSDYGYGYPLAVKWRRNAPTRDQALSLASSEIHDQMQRYCAGADESNHAKRQARLVRDWAAGLH